MVDLNFEELFATLKDGVARLAKETITDYAKEATAEGQKALMGMKDDLRQWCTQVASGELGKDDMEFLVAGRNELIEMRALLQLGVTKIQVDKFVNGITSQIVGTLLMP